MRNLCYADCLINHSNHIILNVMFSAMESKAARHRAKIDFHVIVTDYNLCPRACEGLINSLSSICAETAPVPLKLAVVSGTDVILYECGVLT